MRRRLQYWKNLCPSKQVLFELSSLVFKALIKRDNFIHFLAGHSVTPEKSDRRSKDCGDQGNLAGHSVTPEKSGRGSKDCGDQGNISKYSRKSPPSGQDQNSRKRSYQEHSISTKQSSSSTAMHNTTSTGHHQNTWTVDGCTYVFDDKVKVSSVFASLQLETQLETSIQHAHKCLTGTIRLGPRKTLFSESRRVITFRADIKTGEYAEYNFDMCLTRENQAPQNFRAVIAMSYYDAKLKTWELNLYRVTSVSTKSKELINSITKIEPDIDCHIKVLIDRVMIFIKALFFLSKFSTSAAINDDTSIKISSVTRMVYEYGKDKHRLAIVDFLVEKCGWFKLSTGCSYASKLSAVYHFPNI